MNPAALSRRRALISLIVLFALALVVVIGSAGCSAMRSDRVEVAADYVRCSIDADYDSMSKVVAEEARPYCHALAAAPQPSEPLAQILDETWQEDSLIIEITYGGEEAATFMRLSPPTEDAPDEVVVETWNKLGDSSDGTLTVVEESGKLVVTHIDGEPIEEVMAVGSGGL